MIFHTDMSQSSFRTPSPNALLLLEDGTEFTGYGIGMAGLTTGELCFNTAMTGYQEILTDPSYYGQIITFTMPHIGNVGCNEEDTESRAAHAKGLVIREPITAPSSWRAASTLDTWLTEKGLTGISGIDTRALTLHIRRHGHLRAAIAYHTGGIKAIDREAVQRALASTPSMAGAEMTAFVRREAAEPWSEGVWRSSVEAAAEYHVVAVDYGAKSNILRLLVEKGCSLSVVPGDASAESILALKPDGVFLSNGPGDPAATGLFAVPVIIALLERGIPLFGICLGHQLLALSLGAATEKMPQGHRGANHPVQALATKKVEITSQNHGFAVSRTALPAEVEVTHLSLFDGTVQGIRHRSLPAFSVQYHPESSPGPHDSEYLFDAFIEMMRTHKTGGAEKK